jgi:hypothetical protein
LFRFPTARATSEAKPRRDDKSGEPFTEPACRMNFCSGAFFFAIGLNPLLLIFHQTLYRRIPYFACPLKGGSSADRRTLVKFNFRHGSPAENPLFTAHRRRVSLQERRR